MSGRRKVTSSTGFRSSTASASRVRPVEVVEESKDLCAQSCADARNLRGTVTAPSHDQPHSASFAGTEPPHKIPGRRAGQPTDGPRPSDCGVLESGDGW